MTDKITNSFRKSHPELFLMLGMGIEPQKLIERGYSKATVYKYNKQLKEAKKIINELF